MSNNSQSASRMSASDIDASSGSSRSGARLGPIQPEAINEIFLKVGQNLREGLSSRAEDLLTATIEKYSHTEDDLANLRRLLAFTLETVGRYKESLEAVQPYEDAELRSQISTETQVRVTTQLAISYNNLGDHPKAVTLLKEISDFARDNELNRLLGSVDIGLSRVYRKLNECAICRGYAEKALTYFRENGDWLGMAEAYREIALSYHQEGNSEKSLEFFDLGIQIIGDRSAPFMLGKLYTDMSGAYWFLRRPKDGIACLEKSIGFFQKTEHALNSIIAYNNLGINFVLIGEWSKAEEMVKRALDLAIDKNHVHMAGILDSLGEIKILRGQLEDAEDFLEQAVRVARERKREWYEAQAMRNQARCYLAQGRHDEAIAKAQETITLCEQIGDKHHAIMAGLVLAEGYLRNGALDECEDALNAVEESDPTSDFYVLGNIQRIRGLAALEDHDRELAVHYFNRSLTIFEAAEDVYHAALANLLIGENLGPENKRRATNHLINAGDAFRRLGLRDLADRAERDLTKVKENVSGEFRAAHAGSAASQLLMVRLAEATASRELLFRELVAVLQQESRANKLIIAEPNDEKKLIPFITHGYQPAESIELMQKLEDAGLKGEEKTFIRNRNITVFHLKTTNAKPAVLVIQPQSGAVLNDGGPLLPLVRVVELGLDVIALREKEKTAPVEQGEHNPHTSNNLMPGFIHSSPAMTSLVDEVYKIRSSDVTVLVTGESGTGKELVSRAIHTLSNRKDKIFVPFNCTAVPKELAEGHLFGYRKGAFTGAVTDSPGMIRAADGGTLFLDEVGDLPLDVQPKLLRFLQEGEVQPIGEKRPIRVDVRVIAATNMPLEEKVADGTFREDLYYRLNVIRLRVPPLRERRSEIPPIVNYYINHYSTRFGKHDITFTPQTVDLLMVCNWEGNVRQLCNEVQRIIARAVDNEVVTPDHLSPELKRTAKPLSSGSQVEAKPIASFDGPIMPFKDLPEGGTLEQAVTELEMQMIRAALSRHGWNISRVAKELGVTRRGLYLKIARYGIEKAA